MNFKSIASVGLVLIAFALAACTRQDATKATVNIAIPQKMNSNKVGAFAADDTLMRVTINVSGPGLPGPILMNWDACRDCPADTGSFASLFVDVPTGDNRLFQVLAVYKSSSTKTMSFYYGEEAKSLVTAQEAIKIKVNSVSQGLQVVQGQVSGRLLDTVATGPTDEVEIRYNPGDGKPSLIIDRSYILNGWFRFFMLTGVAFEYRTKSGGLLFGGPVSLDSPQFAVGGDRNRRLKMMIPVHLRQQYGNAPAGTYSPDEAMIYVWGIWGDASVISDRAVCPINMFAGFTKMKAYTTGTTYTNLATSNVTALTIADLLNTTTPKNYAYYDGGAAVSVAGGVTTCDGTVMDESSVATGTLYRKHYKVDIAYADGDGKDSAAGFYGPYRRLSNGRGVSSAVVNNATEVSGILLPGLSGMFTQFTLFKRPISAGTIVESYIDSDEIDCRQVAAGAGRFAGFVPAGETTPNASGEFKIVSNISAAEASSGVNGILCPSIAGVMIKQGGFMDRCSLGGCVVGNSNPPAKLAVRKLDNNPNYSSSGTCERLEYRLQDSTSKDTTNNTGAIISMVATATVVSGNFYNDLNSCMASTGANSNIIFPIGIGSVSKIFKATTSSIDYSALGVTSLPASLTAFPANVKFVDPTGTTRIFQFNLPSTQLAPGICYPIYWKISKVDGSNDTTWISGTVTVTVTATSAGADPVLSTTSNCASPANVINPSYSTTNTGMFYMMIPAGTPSGTGYTINMTKSTIYGTQLFLAGSGGSSIDHFIVRGMSNMTQNTCNSVTIIPVNNAGIPIPAPAGFTGSLLPANGAASSFFSSSADCVASTPQTTTVTFAIGDVSRIVYFKGMSLGSYTILAQATVSGVNTVTGPECNSGCPTGLIANVTAPPMAVAGNSLLWMSRSVVFQSSPNTSVDLSVMGRDGTNMNVDSCSNGDSVSMAKGGIGSGNVTLACATQQYQGTITPISSAGNLTIATTINGIAGPTGTIVSLAQPAYIWNGTTVTGGGMVDFGTVSIAHPSVARIAFTNSTGGTITFTITASGDYAYSAGNCGGSLTIGAACEFDITFNPTASGTRAGGVTFSSGITGSIPFTGIGAP